MRFARLIGYVALIACAAYLVTALWRHADALPTITWDRSTFAVLISCLALYLAQISASGLAWHFWLNAAREVSHPQLAIALFAISQFAKYLPGGFAQHIARVALGKRHGLGTPGMVVTIALEQSWALIAAGAIAAPMILAVGWELNGIALPSPLSVGLFVGLVLAVPPAIIWLGGAHRPRFLEPWLGAWRTTHPNTRTVASCFLLYATGTANCGWNINLVATYMFGAEQGHALLAINVYAIAWIVGFVTLVAPGGIGVRDAILLAGLTPAYGAGSALAATITYRIITAIGDALACILGLLVEKRLRARNTRNAQSE